MTGRRRSAPRALAAVAALALLAACGADPAAPPSAAPAPSPTQTPTPTPAGPAVFAPVEELLTATATQTRVNIANGGEFRVMVTNRGQQPFTVTAVRLSSPAFVPLPMTELSTDYSPGDGWALETGYGDAVCDVSSVEPLRAVLRLREAAGDREVEVAMDAPYDLMTRIHDRTCQERAFREQATLSLGAGEPRDGPDGPELQAALEVRRGAATGPISVGSVRNSVVYAVDVAPVVLAADQDLVRTPLTVRVPTCAGHIIGEAKQPYLFLATATLAGQAEQGVVLTVSAEQEQSLRDLLRRACA